MFGLLTVEIIVISILVISWFFATIRISSNQKLLLYIPFVIALILIETLRDGTINPDYNLYLQYIRFPDSYKGDLEYSFFSIVDFSQWLGGEYLTVFFIYAILGISLKFIAIYKYSFNFIYSLCVWLCFSFILHDLIQIRASVAASMLLFMIPSIYNRNISVAFLFWIIAFFFHNSAIIFGIIFILKRDSINPLLWIGGYLLIFLINITNYPIFDIIFYFISYIPGTLADRIGDSDPNILNELSRMSMYSRYILIPSIFSIGCLYYIKEIQRVYPFSILCLKLSFISIFCYGIGLPIVSERLFELLQIPMIFLVPTALSWFKHNKMLRGKIIVTIFCLFMSWNLLFKQAVFS